MAQDDDPAVAFDAFRDELDWQVIATVLGEEFGDVRPANTAIVAGFPFPDVKVEITATAVIGCG